MKRTVILLLLVALCSYALIGCTTKEPSQAMQTANAYIDGFWKFYELGGEYTEQGLQLQAKSAYSWAAASISSMRYCIDCLLSMKSKEKASETLAQGRPSDWNEIAAMNYSSPYPWFFEGLVDQAQGKKDEATVLYENALVNPAFDAEYGKALLTIGAMPSEELKILQKKLTGLEDKIFTVYTPKLAVIPRDARSFDDVYLCLRAQETLEADKTDYRGGLRYYEAALKVNPFEGDNFVGCALMSLYLNDIDRTFFYVNEGLFVDPKHEGLNQLANLLNKEGTK